MAPPRWLLLRGLVREQRHWADFPARLAERTGVPVMMLDLPGVGTEHARASPASIAAIVADIRGRWLAARGDGPWRLFAPSLGGMIALAWAEAHPEDFEAVAVCNTSAGDVAGPLERLTPEALWAIVRALFANGVRREDLILGLVSNTPHGRAHAGRFAEFTVDAPIRVRVLLQQLWAGSKVRTPPGVKPALLVMCSDGDRLCLPKASRALAEKLGAPCVVHPDAGHDLPLDDPAWVADRLAEWR